MPPYSHMQGLGAGWVLKDKCLAYHTPPAPTPKPAGQASCLAIRMHCHCGFSSLCCLPKSLFPTDEENTGPLDLL